jgi:hypothetical protein
MSVPSSPPIHAKTLIRDFIQYAHYHVIQWLWRGFGLVIGFIGHLQIVTTSNYSDITNSHTPQFTTARTKSSQSDAYSPVVAWWQIPRMSFASVLTFIRPDRYLATNLLSLSLSLMLRATVSRPVCLGTKHTFLSDSCGFVDVRRSLWRADGSVICNCCWPSPAQSFSGPSPVGLSWNKSPIWCLRPDLYYCQTVAGLLMWGALSDVRTVLSFARVTVSSNKFAVNMYNLHFTCY